MKVIYTAEAHVTSGRRGDVDVRLTVDGMPVGEAEQSARPSTPA